MVARPNGVVAVDGDRDVGGVRRASRRRAGRGVAINGTFTAFSDGQWAKTNDSYHDELSVTQTWTITSTCATYQDCTGRVTSDQGGVGTSFT